MVDFDIAEDGDPQPPEEHGNEAHSEDYAPESAVEQFDNNLTGVARNTNSLTKAVGRVQFELGLEQLGYETGFFDTFVDQSRLSALDGVELNDSNQAVLESDIDAGDIAYPTLELGFVPTAAVLADSATIDTSNRLFEYDGGDITLDSGIENGQTLSYALPDGPPDSAVLEFTGNTRSDSESRTGEYDNEQFDISIGGTEDVDLTAAISGTVSESELAQEDWVGSVTTDGFGSFAVVGGEVYVVKGESVYSFDETAGDENWSSSLDGDNGGFVYDDEEVYVSMDEAGVAAFDAGDGSRIWTSEDFPVDTNAGVPSVTPDHVIGISSSNQGELMLGLDRTDGSTLWSDSGGRGGANSVETDGVDIYYDYYDGEDYHIESADPATGDVNWTTTTDASGYPEYPQGVMGVVDGVVYLEATGGIEAYDAEAGDQLWVYSVETGEVSRSVLGSGVAYLTTDTPEFIAVDVDTQTRLWGADVADEYGQSSVGDPFVYFAENDDNLIAFSKSDGTEVFTYTDAGNIYKPAYDNGAVYTLSQGGSGNVTKILSPDPTTDPVLSVGGDEVVSRDGILLSTETETGTVAVSPGTSTIDVGSSAASVDVELDWTEATITTDPTLVIDSPNGSQTVDYDGQLDDGVTETLSSSVDTSLLEGDVTLSVEVSPSASNGIVDVKYSHGAETVTFPNDVYYEIADDAENARIIDQTDADQELNLAFDSENVTITPKVQRESGAATPALSDFAIYFQS